jgi:hypothetical protein
MTGWVPASWDGFSEGDLPLKEWVKQAIEDAAELGPGHDAEVGQIIEALSDRVQWALDQAITKTAKACGIDLIQWWKNGDHPEDGVGEVVDDPGYPGKTYTRQEGTVVRYFRHPDFRGDDVDPACGKRWHDHGWIDNGGDGITVHPGDYVYAKKERYGL